MAIACGGTVFGTEGSDLKLEKASMGDLGEVEEVTITKDDTLLLRGKGDQRDIEQRMEMINDQIEDTKSQYEKEKVMERKFVRRLCILWCPLCLVTICASFYLAVCLAVLSSRIDLLYISNVLKLYQKYYPYHRYSLNS